MYLLLLCTFWTFYLFLDQAIRFVDYILTHAKYMSIPSDFELPFDGQMFINKPFCCFASDFATQARGLYLRSSNY